MLKPVNQQTFFRLGGLFSPHRQRDYPWEICSFVHLKTIPSYTGERKIIWFYQLG